MKKFLVLLLGSFFLMAGVAMAESIPFVDETFHWPGWTSSISSQNTTDSIGTPNWTGGYVEVYESGYLKKIYVEQYSPRNGYNYLSPGDLFINATNDGSWDYVVELALWSEPYGGTTISKSGSGHYQIYTVDNLPIAKPFDNSNPGYTLSTPGGWPSNLIPRHDHPVAWVKPEQDQTSMGTAYFSGWPSLPSSGPVTTPMCFDFNDGLIYLNEFFTFGWTQNCANDVLLVTLQRQVPEPATMLLLGFGLVGLAVIGRRKLR